MEAWLKNKDLWTTHLRHELGVQSFGQGNFPYKSSWILLLFNDRTAGRL